MLSVMKAAIALAAGLTALPAAVLAAGEDPPATAECDKPVKDFTLKDVSEGKDHKLSAHKGRIVLVIFYNHTCGTCPSYDGRFKKFAAAYKDKGVSVIGIDAHANNTAEAARESWDPKQMGFPLLKDEKGDVVKFFDVSLTPTCFVIDGKGVLRYHGAFDNSDNELNVSRTFVKDAVEAIRAGKPVETKYADPFG
jgi:peroxiredoxin